MTLATQSAKPVLAQLDQRSPPVLKTERLMLRAPRRGDGKAIVRLVNDRRVAENTVRIPHPYFLDDAETFVAAANRQAGEATFAILCDDALIGMCGVEPRQDGPEIGYWLGVPFWGRGYATEAVRAAIDHAFGLLGHDTLQAAARVSNPSSRRVLEKCVSVDRSRSLPHPRDQFLGAARPLPSRPRPVGVVEGLGTRPRSSVTAPEVGARA